MSKGIWRALLAFAGTCVILLLVISYTGTRWMATHFFHGDRVLPSVYACAVELGIVGLGAGVILRRWAKLPTRAYEITLGAVLSLSLASNLFAGADSVAPERSLFASLLASGAWWTLPLMCLMPVPAILGAFVGIFSALLVERRAPIAAPCAPQERPRALAARITEIYTQQPELPPVEVARTLGCSPSTVRKVRARVIQK